MRENYDIYIWKYTIAAKIITKQIDIQKLFLEAIIWYYYRNTLQLAKNATKILRK